MENAIQHFEEAIERDPKYAPAYAGLAYSYRTLAQGLGAIPYLQVVRRIEDLARKALELDDTLGEAHAVLGDVQRAYHWNWTEAEREYKLAIELDPSSYQAPNGYAFLMGAMGHHDEALALGRRAEQLDPLNLRVRAEMATNFLLAGRYDEAIEQAQTVLEIDPDFQRAYNKLSNAYEGKELYPEAAEARLRELLLGGADEVEVAGLLEAAASGKETYWRWKLGYYEERAKQQYVSARLFARIYAQLGERDQAFQWLEKAYLERSGLFNIKVSPIFDPPPRRPSL